MIVYQYPAILDGKPNRKYIRSFSDIHKKIIQVDTGEVLEDAVDEYPSIHTYEEHENYIEEYEPKEESLITNEDIIEIGDAQVQ
ncbi:MAG: hypothetical protein ACI35W_03980 [Anaeroplasmataceae bacterium]